MPAVKFGLRFQVAFPALGQSALRLRERHKRHLASRVADLRFLDIRSGRGKCAFVVECDDLSCLADAFGGFVHFKADLINQPGHLGASSSHAGLRLGHGGVAASGADRHVDASADLPL